MWRKYHVTILGDLQTIQGVHGVIDTPPFSLYNQNETKVHIQRDAGEMLTVIS